MKRVFNKEQTTNLTELTDKTIQENRDSADSKTQKQVALAAGTGDVAALLKKSFTTCNRRVVHLLNQRLENQSTLIVYNTTSQF